MDWSARRNPGYPTAPRHRSDTPQSRANQYRPLLPPTPVFAEEVGPRTASEVLLRRGYQWTWSSPNEERRHFENREGYWVPAWLRSDSPPGGPRENPRSVGRRTDRPAYPGRGVRSLVREASSGIADRASSRGHTPEYRWIVIPHQAAPIRSPRQSHRRPAHQSAAGWPRLSGTGLRCIPARPSPGQRCLCRSQSRPNRFEDARDQSL